MSTLARVACAIGAMSLAWVGIASFGDSGDRERAAVVSQASAGGVAEPADPVRQRVDGAWMTVLANSIDAQGRRVGDIAKLNQIAMPGSHDAGSWGTISYADGKCADSGFLVDLYNANPKDGVVASTVESWSFTQYDEPYWQLVGGSRYFDLRAIRDKSPGDGGNYFLRACHTTIGAQLGAFFDPDYPTSLVAYAAENPGEVIVVDWQHVFDEAKSGGGLTAAGIKDFREFITADVCPNHALTAGDMSSGKANAEKKTEADIPMLTLAELANTGKNIIHVMDGDIQESLADSLDEKQKPGWCMWNRDVLLQSKWDTDDSSSPWKNGFDYAKARTSLFRNQADWLLSGAPQGGTFHVNQNIWAVNPDGIEGILNTVGRLGLRNWTETELRPYQNDGFIQKYLIGNTSAARVRQRNANVLMTDFVTNAPSGTVFQQVAKPWIALNCRKFAITNCPWT